SERESDERREPGGAGRAELVGVQPDGSRVRSEHVPLVAANLTRRLVRRLLRHAGAFDDLLEVGADGVRMAAQLPRLLEEKALEQLELGAPGNVLRHP